MWDSRMLATIHVARNQRYSAQNMAEKAYIHDRLMHREGARLIQLNDVAHLFCAFRCQIPVVPSQKQKKKSAESQKLHHFDA